jgi:hypothetical protein
MDFVARAWLDLQGKEKSALDAEAGLDAPSSIESALRRSPAGPDAAAAGVRE